MQLSQNDYPVLSPSDTMVWNIPVTSGPPVKIRLKPGHCGFVLANYMLYHHEKVEPINTQKQLDDWGYAEPKLIPGTTSYSNHASGTAVDINATLHPWKVRGTYKPWQVKIIHNRLTFMFGVVRWGGDYTKTVDEMHFEINASPYKVRGIARILARFSRGRRILKANPSFKL